MEKEYRAFPVEDLELRVEGDDKPMIRGYAAVFNKLSVPLFGFREKIAPGAFSKTVKKSDIRALWNHDPNYVLGRNKAKTLSLMEDDKGLFVEIEPPGAQWAKDLTESIKRGDVTQMSFGFRTIKDDWLHEEGKESIRTLLEVELFDVSPVTFPAYPQTSVKVRSILANEGIEWEKLAGILFRAQRGLPLLQADRELINASIEMLRSYLSSGDGAKPGDGAGDGEAGRLMSTIKRLEIAERAIL